MYFVWRGRRSNLQPPACPGNFQPLHYPAGVTTKCNCVQPISPDDIHGIVLQGIGKFVNAYYSYIVIGRHEIVVGPQYISHKEFQRHH